MIKDALMRVLEREFPFQMTTMQHEAAQKLCDFLVDKDERGAFILLGYAGTGKTTLLGALVRCLNRLQRSVVLMAPTGRAAKVFTLHAGHPAFTIHKVIYRQRKKNDVQSGFSLNLNKFTHTLFIVDEASMISNEAGAHPVFGSGCLLDDLCRFVYSGNGCRLLFVGDTAQLPPVGEALSPALTTGAVTACGLHVNGALLTEVMRQSAQSGILHNATHLRQLLTQHHFGEPPAIDFTGFQDICDLAGSELIDALEESYAHGGTEQTIVITRSNKTANLYNKGIRATIFGREQGLAKGDVVMIARNNYYWTELLRAHLQEDENLPMDFIANGDIAIVTHIQRFLTLYDLHFADVTLTFPDYNHFEMDVRVILEALESESPALNDTDSQQLFQGVLEDYAEFPNRKKQLEKLREDPNYNAVQIKYAYAVTCHKAQGGQWDHVFLDQGWLPPDGADANYLRWLYTAFTRATNRLHLINWPEKQHQHQLTTNK
jgi:exodeoxyribonuclease-5